MKKNTWFFCWSVALIAGCIFVFSFASPEGRMNRFPYQQAGLSERQAAAHLLSRFSFGAMPGQVDEVMKTGLEKWFGQQLNSSFQDKKVDEKLAGYSSLTMSNAEIVQSYPQGGQLLKMAIQDGVVNRDSAKVDKKDNKQELRKYMNEKGLKPQADLLRELVNQKIIRAAFSDNQLREVMTDFWFNHFNVAIAKNGVMQFVTSYERDVIRPNSLGKFETLLLATAQSPAMLTYLDNNKSSVSEENMTQEQMKRTKRTDALTDTMLQGNANSKIKKPKMQGVNENYAREIMELHTMGVDAGYSQTDIINAARILTGWSLNPQIEYNIKTRKKYDDAAATRAGFVHDDNFLFAVNKHDKAEKEVLGQNFPAGGGYDEGLKLIHLLATHPSTASFLCKKLAIRFVNDNPPQSLIDKMTRTFRESEGDIKKVLLTMVSAVEFWSKEAVLEKTKSPFELAISSVRATGAEIQSPFQLYQWINKMGQKMYNYQAPTGFPDKGQYWINSGSLLNRMNFGLMFASSRIPGIRLDIPALNNHHEPESAEAALKTYCSLLLPGRNVEETIKRLTPMLNDPDLQNKVDQATIKASPAQDQEMNSDDMMNEQGMQKKIKGKPSKKLNKKKGEENIPSLEGNNNMQSQVVGIIIGSPEFQRR